MLQQEGRPDPVPAERAVAVVQGPSPGAQDRPPQDEPQVPVLPLHRHQGLRDQLVRHGPGRSQGLRRADPHSDVQRLRRAEGAVKCLRACMEI